ncbi:MAG: hypothetical protein HC876_01630 [Chloroflexaceae bacterium]|nr:hypothetical protein [Chloroflexaceae bacterium]
MRIRNSLLTQLITRFLLTMLLSVIVVSGVAFWQARNALQRAAFEQLEVAALIKTDEIDNWIENQEDFLAFLARSQEVQRHARFIDSADLFADLAAYHFFENLFVDVLERQPELEEVFILSLDSQIVISTNSTIEGTYQIDATYFAEGQTDTVVQEVYISPATGEPTITVATPLIDNSGFLRGVLAAHLNLNELDEVVLERAGLGETGEAYLVDSLNNLVAGRPAVPTAFNRGVQTEGINAAIQGQDGMGLYNNYMGVPVVGVYFWIEERHLALLVEMYQDEAFLPARQLAGTVIIVGIIATAVMTFSISYTTRKLSARLRNCRRQPDWSRRATLTRRCPCNRRTKWVCWPRPSTR